MASSLKSRFFLVLLLNLLLISGGLQKESNPGAGTCSNAEINDRFSLTAGSLPFLTVKTDPCLLMPVIKRSRLITAFCRD
jgi:hypothetical protein